ncbi:MAG: rhodanese-like domain-containing protein [Verrucomicrobia bacterium]|nr:rhodanese-like domain-containing protein [Verrucomicrobiota bacterium]
MLHAPGFLKIVNDTRPLVKEIALEEARRRLEQNPQAILLDVREDKEWDKGHAVRAMHLGKGVLERDIEERISNKQTEILMYCGGGYRSVLACEVAQRMGYSNVFSVEGGYRAMTAANWPMAT